VEGPEWAFGLRLRTHARYLRYVLLHKWWVFWWGLKLGVPSWTLLAHDMSKFSKEEWGPYARWFYTCAPDGREWYAVYKEAIARHPGCASEPWWSARHLKADFDQAWSHHKQHNKHHPEYWSDGLNQPMDIPDVFIREMVADWFGAGYAKGNYDIMGWYVASGHKLPMSLNTRERAEFYLSRFV
jgi:Family of unknown function (DUF5662)